jgi:thioesterase domain-containing protein/acyl carrier protein
VHVGAGRIDWELVPRLSPLVSSSNTYTSLLRTARDSGQRGSIVARLRSAAEQERGRLIEDFIVTQVAGVFGTAEAKIDRSAPLTTLGLDSLMVLDLTNRVERELGLRIPMAGLLSGPTVAELAQTVLRLLGPTLGAPPSQPSTSAAAPQGHIVLLRAGGGEPPVFAFHGAGGGVGIYAGLAPHLPETVALYGVESRLKQGAEREYRGIDEIVDRYAAAIRDANDGPYRLLGFSLGGYVAARVAEALEHAGAPVQFVGVMDWDPRQKATAQAQQEGLTRLAVAAYLFAEQEIGLVRPMDESQLGEEIARLVTAILADDTAGSDVFFRWVTERRLVTAPALEPVTRQHLNRFEQHCRLLTRALPLPRFRAPLCIWRARDGFGSGLESWEHLGELSREHVVDGDHNALIRPAALQLVGRQMTEFLARIAERYGEQTAGREQPV